MIANDVFRARFRKSFERPEPVASVVAGLPPLKKK